MAQSRRCCPTAVSGTKTRDDDDGGGARGERNYARKGVTPPALGRLTEGQN